MPRPPSVKKAKKQKTRHAEHPVATGETSPNANGVSVGSKEPNGFLPRLTVGDDGWKPNPFVGGKKELAAIKTNDLITSNEKPTFPDLESTLSTPFVKVDVEPLQDL